MTQTAEQEARCLTLDQALARQRRAEFITQTVLKYEIRKVLRRLEEHYPGHRFVFFNTMGIADVEVQPRLRRGDYGVRYLADSANSMNRHTRFAYDCWTQIRDLYEKVAPDKGSLELGEVRASETVATEQASAG